VATILHVDMDAFFAAVEVRFDPSLAGRPVVVGGSGRRGVVAAASYEARAYGVRSAMPAAQARRLCPQAVFVPGRYDRYSEISQQIHEIFHAYTPLVEGIALDEAFLDVTGASGLFGEGLAIGRRIREQLHCELGLWASVGVAGSKFVAKLASEAAKPRASRAGVVPGAGVVVVGPGEELAFLGPLPIEALWGVGPVTAARLRGLGVTTIGELAAVPVDSLERSLGSASGRHLYELAWARDRRPVQPNRAVQSIGHEETYPWDRDDRVELHREVVRMADAVASRLRAAGVTGRTVTLKLRYGDFSTITRSHTLSTGVDTGPAIARAAGWLLDQERVDTGIRLLGVSVANLTAGAPHQLSLALGPHGGPSARGGNGAASPPASAPMRVPASAAAGAPSSESTDQSWHEATRAVDQVRARFGQGAVGPAVLLEQDGIRLKRVGDNQWGPSPSDPESGESGAGAGN
jgi:DNA polymerase IV